MNQNYNVLSYSNTYLNEPYVIEGRGAKVCIWNPLHKVREIIKNRFLQFHPDLSPFP